MQTLSYKLEVIKIREVFAETLYELGCDGNHMANECERFGMAWGCREDCPTLEKGNCEHWKSVDEYIEEMENKK